jgi:hypothetical protein
MKFTAFEVTLITGRALGARFELAWQGTSTSPRP